MISEIILVAMTHEEQQFEVPSTRKRAPKRTLAQQRTDLIAQLADLDRRLAGGVAEETNEIISAIISLKSKAMAAKLGALVTACEQASSVLTNAAPKKQ